MKKDNWIKLNGDGDIGLHLPAGHIKKEGFLSITDNLRYFSIVGFANEKTGEIKLFLKKITDEIGMDNLKL